MLDWLAEFADDPTASAMRVPGVAAPIYLVVTPVRRTTLKFLLAEQFRAVKLIGFDSLT